MVQHGEERSFILTRGEGAQKNQYSEGPSFNLYRGEGVHMAGKEKGRGPAISPFVAFKDICTTAHILSHACSKEGCFGMVGSLRIQRVPDSCLGISQKCFRVISAACLPQSFGATSALPDLCPCNVLPLVSNRLWLHGWRWSHPFLVRWNWLQTSDIRLMLTEASPLATPRMWLCCLWMTQKDSAFVPVLIPAISSSSSSGLVPSSVFFFTQCIYHSLVL